MSRRRSAATGRASGRAVGPRDRGRRGRGQQLRPLSRDGRGGGSGGARALSGQASACRGCPRRRPDRGPGRRRDHLPVDDCSFDAAVACLVLCTVPDQMRALAEMRRVLRPGGELRFYEHVLSDRRALALSQRAVDRVFWPRAFWGVSYRSGHTRCDCGRRLRGRGSAPYVGQPGADRIPGWVSRHRPCTPTLRSQQYDSGGKPLTQRWFSRMRREPTRLSVRETMPMSGRPSR